MKNIPIYLLSLCLLAACSKPEPEEQAKRAYQNQQQAAIQDARVHVRSVSIYTTDSYYSVRKICVDDTWYLINSHSLLQMHDKDGKPIECDSKP